MKVLNFLRLFNYIMWGLIAFFIFSCRSPQQLIDKAVKKDPTILVDRVDTIQVETTVVDSFPVIIHDSIVWEKILRDTVTNVIVKSKPIYIERKKTRLELRKEAQNERLLIRSERRIKELELKNQKLQSKLDAKVEQKQIKADKKRSFWWLWYLLGLITLPLIYAGYWWVLSRMYRGMD